MDVLTPEQRQLIRDLTTCPVGLGEFRTLHTIDHATGELLGMTQVWIPGPDWVYPNPYPDEVGR